MIANDVRQAVGFRGISERVINSAAGHYGRIAFTHLEYPGRSSVRRESAISIGDLDKRARAVANALLERGAHGDRALLLFKPGLDFVVAFLGCLYAGVVAVPSAVPRHGIGLSRTMSMLKDSGATIALSTSGTQTSVRSQLAASDTLAWVLLDDLPNADNSGFVPFSPAPDDPALLQYSSGSTGDPKGVVISHFNLVHQAELIFNEVGAKPHDSCLTWLPIFHDMGLVSSVVMPLAMEMHSVFMAPEAFVLNPARWLRALSDFRTNYCASPNFGYELCARRIQDEEIDGIDLSALRYAVCGAEPVRAGTIDRFHARFAKFGFSREKIYPAYGLAEATLLVTGNKGAEQTTTFLSEPLGQGNAVPAGTETGETVTLVSCGPARGDNEIRIVDPETAHELPEGRTGEIWVRGGSVGLGYWGDDAERNAAFRAKLADDPSKEYLRTGDYGFLHAGSLFVRGRLKDLIIVRGANHHATDIEQTIEACDPALAPSSGAAFSIDIDEQERLIVVQELERSRHDLPEDALSAIVSSIRQNLSERHELLPYAIVLLSGGIPKTTSGKVRRHECKSKYLAGTLNPVYEWLETDGGDGHQDTKASASAEDLDVRRQIDMEVWLLRVFAALRNVDPSRFTAATRLAEFATESTAMHEVARRIKHEFGLAVPYTMFSEYETIGELASYLANGVATRHGNVSAGGNRLSAEALEALPEHDSKGASDERIAIIGIACRFPSANGPREFWKNLCNGVDSVTTIPPERWDCDAFYDENPLAIGKMNTRHGGFLRDIESFDARFFGIQTREATRMDPAHRILLELSWEAFEDAGILPASVSGVSVGVYIGISGSDYAQLQFGDETLSDPYAGVGCALTNAASRISHFHNLRGPALAIDTACSSSLSSLHLGCMAIRSGECDMVLAGGVNIILAPSITMSLSKAGMMAPDGRCKTFDKSADGYVRSEGAGLVLLKPYARALADGDAIYAVIRGSATNQDGRSSAISAPNGEAQQRVVLAACGDAGISPGQLDYVEAHGTGTAVGDPIEVNALGEVLKIGVDNDGFCAIGSVKTNIGHCESAAGIASIIKAAHVLHKKQIPPSLHFSEPNPLISFQDFRVRVQERLAPLAERSRPRLVGVNSFGIGGTNVHVVLEEFESRRDGVEKVRAEHTGPWLLPLSARSEKSLKQYAKLLSEYLLERGNDADLASICYTLAQRRTHHDHRLAVIGTDAAQLATTLESYQQSGYASDASYAHRPAAAGVTQKVAFVFSGQGSQWWAMGRGLYEAEPVFRREIERCDAGLRPHTGWSLIDVLMASEQDSLLGETAYTQPTFFALQVAIVALLGSRGVSPDAVVGHSFGEVAAGYVSGAIAFEDACRLIAIRARLMQPTKGQGRMVSVEMSRAEMETLIASFEGSGLSIAASNSPTTTVVSGPHEALDRLLAEVAARNIVMVELGLDYAFHSAIMEDVRRQFVAEVAGLRPALPRIPLMSTVSAEWCDETRPLTAEYWGENIRNEVRFYEAIEAIVRDGTRLFVEISANPVLSGVISRTLKAGSVKSSVIATLERGVDDPRAILRCLGTLYANGVALDWNAVDGGGDFVHSLPSYQWDRQRFWMEAPHQEALTRTSTHPMVSTRLPVAQPTWQSRLDLQTSPFLSGVRLRSDGGLGNGLFAELAFEAYSPGAPGLGYRELADMEFKSVRLKEGDLAPSLQTTIHTSDQGRDTITVAVQSDAANGRAENWHEVLRCRPRAAAAESLGHMSIEALQSRYPQKFSGAETYRKLGDIGVEYGTSLHIAQDVWVDGGSALVALRIGEMLRSDADRYQMHPLVFEAIEQACRMAAGSGAAIAALGRIHRLRITGRASDAAFAYCELLEADSLGSRRDDGAAFRANVWVLDEHGTILVAADDVSFAMRAREQGDESGIPEDINRWRYRVRWDRVPAAQPDLTPYASPGRWLILADAGDVAHRMEEWLRSHGQTCVLVQPGDAYAKTAENRYTVSTASHDDLSRLFEEMLAVPGAPPLRGVVHMWSLDATTTDRIDTSTFERDHHLGVVSLTDLVQAVSSAELTKSPRLWIVTAGAQPAGESTAPLEVAQSLVWGCAKCIVFEHAELRCSRLDLPARQECTDDDLKAMCEEIWADRIDDQIAFRAGERYLARMDYELPETAAFEPITEDMAPARPYRTIVDGEGRMRLVNGRSKSPGVGEIEIRIEVANVVATTGKFVPPGADHRDLEAQQCVGRILRVGLDSGDLQVGQRVIVLETGALSSHRVVPAAAAMPMPDGLDSDVVAGSVRGYVAALFALREMASLSSGDRVLLRIGDNPLGLAAARVARWLGTKVFVSASASVRPQLEAMNIARVFDEAEPSARTDLDAMMEGRGVDVLINYAADFENSICPYALRNFGRCIDMAADQAAIGLLQSNLPGNVSLFRVDVESLIRDRRDLCRQLAEEVIRQLDSGTFKSQPIPVASLASLAEAIDNGTTPPALVRFPYDVDDNHGPARAYRGEGTYIITGGLGGLGLNIAVRMVRDGARHIALLGRGAPSLAAMDVIAELEQTGARCVPVAVDVSNEAKLREALDGIRRTMPPISGVIHAAGILENGLVTQMDHRQVLAVMPAKVDGAWNLHRLTEGDDLEFFVMFSSLASFIGSPGQSNYGAANAFLEALAEYRQRMGRVGLSVGWGPWSEAGMAANTHNLQRLAQQGMGMLSLEKGLDLLEDVIAERQTGAIGALPMDWVVWGRTRGYIAQTPYFSGVVPQQVVDRGNRAKITADMLSGLSVEKQMEHLQGAVMRAVCQLMMMDAEGIDLDMPLTAMGLDSIIALELKDRLESSIDVIVRTNALIAGKSIRILAQQFREELGRGAPAAQVVDTGTSQTDSTGFEGESELLDRIDELSAEEIEAMLMQMSMEDGAA